MKIASSFLRVFCLAAFILLVMAPLKSQAGFGISPPYVKNDKLGRGSHYEQEIIIVRDKPVEDLQADIEINVPEAGDWLSIDKGLNFILPKGQTQFPIKISIDVPKKADYKNYQGAIRIKTKSLVAPAEETVAIALGAQINVDFSVVKQSLIDFSVSSLRVLDTEEGRPIKILMIMENLGNVLAAPSKVHIDIYDNSENLFASLDNANELKKIRPFSHSPLVAEFAAPNLAAGSYWLDLKIYNGEKIVKESRLSLSLLPKGSLPESGSRRERTMEILLYIFVALVIFLLAHSILIKRINIHHLLKSICKKGESCFFCRKTKVVPPKKTKLAGVKKVTKLTIVKPKIKARLKK